jgi:hypothetical protein
MISSNDTDYIYEYYGIKREEAYIRSENDIENEKKLVNSNRFLSATFLQKHSKINLNKKEIQIGQTIQQNGDDDDEKKLTYCYLCSINAHVHEKTKPVPVSKV